MALSKHLGPPPPPPPKCLDLRDSVRPSSMSGGASPSRTYLSKLLQVFVIVSYIYISMLSHIIVFVFALTLSALLLCPEEPDPTKCSAFEDEDEEQLYKEI